MIQNLVSRILQEIFPFPAYWRLRWNIAKKLQWDSLSVDKSAPDALISTVADYKKLSVKGLEDGLEGEHKRALALDEKTFKHAASIATALTLTSAVSAATSQLISNVYFAFAVFVLSILSAFYVVAGGLLGFGAARTLRTYGVGTRHRLALEGARQSAKANLLAECLARQEQVNLIRVARNEVAFMSIRNGLILLVFAVAVLMFGLLKTSRSSDELDGKVWKVDRCCQADADSVIALATILD